MSSLKPPGGPTSNSDIPLQPFACVRCWKRKKKCDRLLPACSRCTSNKDSCEYSAEPPTRRPDTRGIATYSFPFQHEAFRKRSFDSSGISNNVLSLLHPTRLPYPSPQVTPFQHDNILTDQVYQLIASLKDELVINCKDFLNTTNLWIYITDEAQLSAHLSQIDNHPAQETCTFLLGIYLIAHTPTKKTTYNGLSSVYHVLKPFHLKLISSTNPSVEKIQAGLLIAIYEHAQMLYEASYMTIGACVRMGCLMGMHKTLQESPPNGPEELDVFERHKHIWWCIVLVERLLSLETIHLGLPFASPSPEPTSNLPSFHSHGYGLSLPLCSITPTANSSHPSITFEPTNPFARSAQALHLLTLVIKHTSCNSDTYEKQQEDVVYYDKLLQGFAFSTLEQGNKDKEFDFTHSCTGFLITISALWLLHSHNHSLMPSPSPSPASSVTSPNSTISLLVLRSLTRTAIATIQTKMAESPGSYDTPSFTHWCMREAFEFNVSDCGPEERNEEWRYGMECLLIYMRKVGEKGRCDRDFASNIEKKLNALGIQL